MRVEIEEMTGAVSGVKERDNHTMLLDRWVSVAESQICALEVLCNQVPKVKDILEENMHSLSSSFTVLADKAQEQRSAVENIIDSTVSIKIGGKLTTMKDALKGLSEKARLHFVDDEVQKEIDILAEGYEQKEQELMGLIDEVKLSMDATLAGVSTAIVGMQFQDRVSQNLVIVENILKEVVLYLGGSIASTEEFLNDKNFSPLDKDFAKRLIGLLTLGELQHKFVNDLLDRGYIEDGSEVGYGNEETKMAEGDLELF